MLSLCGISYVYAPPKVASSLGIGLHKLVLAISVDFPIALLSIYFMFTVKDSEIVDCVHENTLLFIFISVNLNAIVAEDDQLYLSSCIN